MRHRTIIHPPRSSTPKTKNALPTCPEADPSRSKGSEHEASDHICGMNGCDKKCFIAGMYLMLAYYHFHDLILLMNDSNLEKIFVFEMHTLYLQVMEELMNN